MIVVRVELHSARTGKKTELARMEIANQSGTGNLRDYEARTLRGRSTTALNKKIVQRSTKIFQHPSITKHVWTLVTKALVGMGYDR